MQIIIPMSGFGERFRSAGYTVPKPLIEVEGKPIIQHVVEMFSDEDDFILTVNNASGEVMLEQVGLLPKELVAPNLATFIQSIVPSVTKT